MPLYDDQAVILQSERVFSVTLQRYMDLKAMTASDLARASGLHRATIHHWLRGNVHRATNRMNVLCAGAALELVRAQVNFLLHLSGLPGITGVEPATTPASSLPATGMQRWNAKARNNLPAPGTSFVGRLPEVVELAARLADRDVRLATLVGPAGVGKTRLALRAAEDLLDAFPDGVFFVDLAPLTSAGEVLPALMRTIGLGQTASATPHERLTSYLRDRSVLLVLDNCEHVLDSAPALAELVGQAHGLALLATSRERLRLSLEQLIEVQPLPLPPLDARPVELRRAPAVALFIQRAALQRPGFQPGPTALRAIAGLCRELDGLPLAIELAAGRADAVEPANLRRSAGQRLDLVSDLRDVPARHRSLRDAIEWSVALLAPRDLNLFHNLAIFAGGWDAGAAAHVHGTRVEPAEAGLQRLASVSLIAGAPAGAEPRWRMLETIRAYAAECLTASNDTAVLRRRHAEYYLARAADAPRYVLYPGDEGWYRRLDVDYGNLVAALGWTRDHDTTLFRRLAAALWPYWHERLLANEGLAWVEQASQVEAQPDAALVAELALGRCYLLSTLGLDMPALAAGRHALALFQATGDRRGEAMALQRLALGSCHAGQYRAALDLAKDALDCWVAFGHSLGLAWSHGDYAFILATHGEFAAANAQLDAAEPLYLEVGNQRGLMRVATERGMTALLEGDLARAVAHLRDGIELGRDLPHNFIFPASLFYLSLAYLFMGRTAEALAYQQQSLLFRRDLGDRVGLSYNVLAFAALAARLDQPALAARWCGAVFTSMSDMGMHMTTMAQAIYARETEHIIGSIGQAPFDAEFNIGCMLSLELVTDEVLRFTQL